MRFLLPSALLCASAFCSVLVVSACGDNTIGAGPLRPGADTGDGRPTGDAGDAGASDTPTPDPDAETPDSSGSDTGLPAECTPLTRECVDATNYRECGNDSRWRTIGCGEFETCAAGVCTLDPTSCTVGDRVCIDQFTPGECVPGEDFRALAPCPADERCSAGQCVSSACASAEARGSYLGCEYLAVSLPNYAYGIGGTPTAPVGLVVANAGRSPAPVWVDAPDGSPATLVGSVTVSPSAFIPGSSPVTVQSQILGAGGAIVEQGFNAAEGRIIPADGMGVFLVPGGGNITTTNVRAAGWTIRSAQPVAAWQFSPYCCNFSYTNDASLLLPVSTLGNEYVVVGVPSWGVMEESTDERFPDPTMVSAPATLTVVASQSGTSVNIQLPPGADVQPDSTGRVVVSGSTVATTLRRGEVLHLFARDPTPRGFTAPPLGPDFTGARVITNRPVAVFSGHSCSYYPQEQDACDHLEEQMFPIETWGRDYVLSPVVLRTTTPDLATEATFFKLVAAEDGTRITLTAPFSSLNPREPGFAGVPDCADRLDGADVIVLNANEFCEFGTRSPVGVRASAPIQVMGIISGEASTGASFNGRRGDPSIFLLPPERQFRSNYTFMAPTTYETDWVTLTVADGSEVTIDGVPINVAGGTLVPGTSWRIVHHQITDGPHRVEGSGPFGMVAYAFDNWVSYAFTGGLDLSKDAEAGR